MSTYKIKFAEIIITIYMTVFLKNFSFDFIERIKNGSSYIE